MTEQLGFLGRNYTRRDQTYTDPYSTSNSNYHHQQQQRLFEQFANQKRRAPQRSMFGAFSSPFGGMGGFQPPQTVRGGFGPMGSYQPFGYPPHFGAGGGGLGRLSFGNSPMGTQRHPPFGFGASALPRTRNPFSHRPRGYSAWPNTHHNLFPSGFLDDDDSDDDDEYTVPSVYRFPSRRRAPRRRYRRPIYGRQPRSRYWEDYDDDYDGFGSFYDEDDDDYEDYFPVTRPRRGF